MKVVYSCNNNILQKELIAMKLYKHNTIQKSTENGNAMKQKERKHKKKTKQVDKTIHRKQRLSKTIHTLELT